MKYDEPPLEVHHRLVDEATLDPFGLILLQKLIDELRPLPHSLDQMTRKRVQSIIDIKEGRPEIFELFLIDFVSFANVLKFAVIVQIMLQNLQSYSLAVGVIMVEGLGDEVPIRLMV